jgi:hypothetical protein
VLQHEQNKRQVGYNYSCLFTKYYLEEGKKNKNGLFLLSKSLESHCIVPAATTPHDTSRHEEQDPKEYSISRSHRPGIGNSSTASLGETSAREKTVTEVVAIDPDRTDMVPGVCAQMNSGADAFGIW